MLRTTFYSETMAAPARPVVLRLVRRDGRVVAPARRSPRPAWALLYALVPLTLAALVAIELLLPEGWGRSAAELAAVAGCIALTRLWIGWNRWGLVRTASQGRPEGAGLHAEPESDQEVG
jgi:hypothetical protein